jgi:hypothetical protein
MGKIHGGGRMSPVTLWRFRPARAISLSGIVLALCSWLPGQTAHTAATAFDKIEQARHPFKDACDQLAVEEITFPCDNLGCKGSWTQSFCVPGDWGNICYTGDGLCCDAQEKTQNVACVPEDSARNRHGDRDPNISDAAVVLLPDKCSQSHRFGVLELDSAGVPVPLRLSKSTTGGL